MTTFVWGDYLTVARRLAAPPTDEADLRTAISRAYYAAYHAAAAFVRAEGILESGHTHVTVWDALAGDAGVDQAEAGRRGHRLKLLRQAADYRNPFPGDIDKQVRFALGEARSLVEVFEGLG